MRTRTLALLLLLPIAALATACLRRTVAPLAPDFAVPGGVLHFTTVREALIADGRLEREMTATFQNTATIWRSPLRVVASTADPNGQIVEEEIVVPGVDPGQTLATPDTMTFRLPPATPIGAITLEVRPATSTGQWTEASFGASGGTIALVDGSTGATFGSGFPSGTWAHVYSIDIPRDRQLFRDTARIFTKHGADPKATHVQVGAPPAGSDVRVWMKVLEVNRRLWAVVPQARFDEFVPLATTVGADGRIEADIPAAAFKAGGTNGSYEALVVTAPPTEQTFSPTPVQQHCPLPSCVVTSGYSAAREHPVLGGPRPHLGVDYRAADGTTVRASASGTVERSYTSATYGEAIIIRHADGSASLYAHLSRRDVFLGDLVDGGDAIGLSGHSGLADGPHLHFEMVRGGDVIGGNRIDPVPWIILTGYAIEIRAVQHNYTPLFWGTQNVIMFEGVTRATFGEETVGTARITDLQAGTYSVRIGYQGGPVPGDALGSYQVEASLAGGTWTALPGEGVPDSPTYDVFPLAPTWYPNVAPFPEGFVWRTFLVAVP